MSTTPKPTKGFTIIELLIVIVVIAVLAAISMVAYNGIQNRARVSSASSTLANFKKAMLAYKTVNGELPPVGDAWNYNTNPPSGTAINNLNSALQAAGYSGLPVTDPCGNYWGYDDNDCNTGSPVGTSTNLKSVGADGLNGTSDDISLLISTKGAC